MIGFSSKFLPLFIGWRYLRAKRRNQFISFVSGFSLLGMAFGVFALIVVLSVMNGFDREIKQRVLRVVPHGFLSQAVSPSEPSGRQEPSGLSHWPAWRQLALKETGIKGAAPYIQGFGLLSYGHGIKGVEVQGISPELESSVSKVHEHMLLGELSRLQSGEFGVILGRLLANYLGVTLGDKIVLTLPQINVTPAGIFPRQKRLKVVSIFEVGAQIDQNLALVHIDDAAKLYRKKYKVDGLRLHTPDIYSAADTLSHLKQQLQALPKNTFEAFDIPPQQQNQLTVKDWSQTQGGLFQAVKMEKLVVGALLMIIVAVAAFNIISSLILMVSDKRSDIAVLRTQGMTSGQIMAIFMVQGCSTGMIGIIIGAILGSVVAIYIGDLVSWVTHLFDANVFDPNVYFVSTLPSLWKWEDLLVICGSGMLLSVLATLYPAWRASQVHPAEALRYE